MRELRGEEMIEKERKKKKKTGTYNTELRAEEATKEKERQNEQNTWGGASSRNVKKNSARVCETDGQGPLLHCQPSLMLLLLGQAP